MTTIEELLLGIAIGDAFGAGVEFQDYEWIQQQVDFSKFINARANIQVPAAQKAAFVKNYLPWDYTDDTEMTIGLIKALLDDRPFSEALLLEYWEKEYALGITQKGYGRNGHGSIAWYYEGKQSMEDIRAFQQNRPNPGNAPVMRVVPLAFAPTHLINSYATINATATHPHPKAIEASQCIAWAAEFLLCQQGTATEVIPYCLSKTDYSPDFETYLKAVDQLSPNITLQNLTTLAGKQPIEAPYFLAGIKGIPSDARYTTGAILFVLKHSSSAFEALKKSVYLGGDVDSVAAVCTGIAAGRWGLDTLPSFMLEQVEGVAYLKQLAQAFGSKFP